MSAGETCVGWDIGGAHLKFAALPADGEKGFAGQLPCPLWRGEERLRAAFECAVEEHGVPLRARHAATMTGELADCFKDRGTGVRRIAQLARARLGADTRFYAADGWRAAEALAREPLAAASMNWHATATWLASRLPRGALLDIGSTTTDIVPFADGRAAARAFSDADRLEAGELVYTGVSRTPVMAVCGACEDARGRSLPVVAELFADMGDAHRLLGDLPARAGQPTCDGAGVGAADNARRLARMFGRDYDGDLDYWRGIAAALAEHQTARIARACETALAGVAADAPLVGAGCGRFVARRLAARLGRAYIDFASLLPPMRDAAEGAVCAPAASLALLLRASR